MTTIASLTSQEIWDLDDFFLNTKAVFDRLVELEEIEFCAACNKYSAYNWRYVNMQDGVRMVNSDGLADGAEEYSDDEILTDWPDVYHIGTCSCAEWTCGNCRTPWVEEDSVYNNYGRRED